MSKLVKPKEKYERGQDPGSDGEPTKTNVSLLEVPGETLYFTMNRGSFMGQMEVLTELKFDTFSEVGVEWRDRYKRKEERKYCLT